MSNHPYECSNCGSKDIEIRVWLILNTDKTNDDGGDDDTWCNKCEDLTRLVTSASEEEEE